MFLLFPAIDLRHGRCVRLRQGDPGAETHFGDDPVTIARRWVDQGASWLHVVNLDGAFDGVLADSGLAAGGPPVITAELLGRLPINLQRLHAIRRAVAVPIQFGGGLRRLEDISLAIALGASRVVLGTVAAVQPDLVCQALAAYGAEAIVVGIDARDGRVATHGWLETSGLDAVDLARSMAAAGVPRVVYTDIQRDGMLSGANVPATVALARQAGLKVIASGGVAGITDLLELRAHTADGIEGAIIGQALYTGALDLRQALAAVA